MDSAEFNVLVNAAMSKPGHGLMRPVIEKELLHYDILFALSREGLLNDFVFQGGTSLRLCYGGTRYSEDLDFAGGADFSTPRLLEIKNVVEGYLGKRYALKVSIKQPAELKAAPNYGDVKVNRWQVSVETDPGRKDTPNQKIKLEVASVPAHTRMLRPLQQNYDFLPDGYDTIVLPVQTMDEILADKLIALPTCTRYIRHRDIWDIAWLSQQRANLKLELIKAKIEDYGVEDYVEMVNRFRATLTDIVNGEDFRNQMQRFIPMDVQDRTLNQDGFTDYLISMNDELLQQAVQAVDGPAGKPDFTM